jgi:subtilase family serine protease
MSASGPAQAVERLMTVGVHDHVTADGTRFYAPTGAVRVPAGLQPTVTSVAGLDNYSRATTEDLRDPKGLSPADASDFYNVNPLHSAGIKGAGQTIYLLEGDEYGPRALAAYAHKFGLPPFDISVKRDSANWGDPAPEGSTGSETDLDVEIVHAIAPDAKIVIYFASLNLNDLNNAMAALVHDHPGSIVSVSIGKCESSDVQPVASQWDSVTHAAAASGASIFVSSGDRGAYGCVGSGDNSALSASYMSAAPSVTSVGGTTVFLSATGGYGSEAAWGEPAQQWGSGGGNSTFFKVPTWQTGPGVHNQYSDGSRQQPDVAANADTLSGWDILGTGTEGPVGGTSAAAPFWAAITALIDQDLTQQALATVGFANPALYRFAQAPSGLPANPFHDITTGNDLYYPAAPGWDYATGLGTPDVAALTDDFEWYAKNPAAHGG